MRRPAGRWHTRAACTCLRDTIPRPDHRSTRGDASSDACIHAFVRSRPASSLHAMSRLQRCAVAFAIAPHAVQDRCLGPDACIHAFALTPSARGNKIVPGRTRLQAIPPAAVCIEFASRRSAESARKPVMELAAVPICPLVRSPPSDAPQHSRAGEHRRPHHAMDRQLSARQYRGRM